MNSKDKKNKDSEKVPEKNYKPSDEKNSDSGLAKTHEQTNDTLFEGTIDREIDEEDGKDKKKSNKDNNE